MKFNKAKKDNHYRYAVSNRKIAACHRKIKQTQAAYPLFAEQVAAEFVPVEQVMAERQAASLAQSKRGEITALCNGRAHGQGCATAIAEKRCTTNGKTAVYLLDRVWTAENLGIHPIPAWMWQKTGKTEHPQWDLVVT